MRRKDLHERTRDLGPNDLAALAAWVEAKRRHFKPRQVTLRPDPTSWVFSTRIPADIYGVADIDAGVNALRHVKVRWDGGSANLFWASLCTPYQAGDLHPDSDMKTHMSGKASYRCVPGEGKDLGYLMLRIAFHVDAREKAPSRIVVSFDPRSAPLLELPNT